MKIGIFSLTDNNYIKGTTTLYHSINENTNLKSYNVDLCTISKDKLVYDNTLGIKDYIIHDDTGLEHSSTYTRFKNTTKKFNALLRDEYDRIIILDSDMLCISDLSELFTFKMNAPIVACEDFGSVHYYPNQIKECGLDINHKFVNTGLMMFERPYIGAEFYKQLINTFSTYKTYDQGDQGYINAYIQHNKLNVEPLLPTKYNYALDGHYPRYNISDISIIHYTGMKPWDGLYDNLPYKLWAKYNQDMKNKGKI